LEVEAVVEPADHRGVAFSLLQVVRCLLDELACLFGKRGIAAATDPATRVNVTTTRVTASHRGSFRLTSLEC
jgi:hypothetical protein